MFSLMRKETLSVGKQNTQGGDLSLSLASVSALVELRGSAMGLRRWMKYGCNQISYTIHPIINVHSIHASD